MRTKAATMTVSTVNPSTPIRRGAPRRSSARSREAGRCPESSGCHLLVRKRAAGVSLQEASVVPRHVEAGVTPAKLGGVGVEPVDEINVRFRVRGERLACATLLDAAVPGADVLADVAAVDLGLEGFAVALGRVVGRLRPVREAFGRVKRPRLVEGSRGARLDAERAGAAVERQRRRRFELTVGDERAEHDPGAETAGDQERVLAVEADAGARRRLAVDVLVLVDEHAVVA